MTRAQQGGQTQLGGPSGLRHTPGFGPVDFHWNGLSAGPSVAPVGTGRVVRPRQKSRGELRACQMGAEDRICRAFQWGYTFRPSRNADPQAAGLRIPWLPFLAGARLYDSKALGHSTVRGFRVEEKPTKSTTGAGCQPGQAWVREALGRQSANSRRLSDRDVQDSGLDGWSLGLRQRHRAGSVGFGEGIEVLLGHRTGAGGIMGVAR